MKDKSQLRLWTYAIIMGAVVFLVSALYLWARRWGMPLEDVAFKLSFAGLAVAGMTLLSLSFLLGPLARFWPNTFVKHLPLRKQYGIVGYFIIMAHVVWGLATFSPAIFPKFFSDGSLKATTIMLLLFGVVAFVLFSIVAFTSIPKIAQQMSPKIWKSTQRIGYLALFLALIHFSVVKYKGWLNIDGWPYLPDTIPFLSLVPLPPLSLILFLFIVFVFVMRVMAMLFPRAENA
ncbi:MAG: ferric reductase-like transmembrane domain-containing protein [Candidatus Paceibacterota bacterium]